MFLFFATGEDIVFLATDINLPGAVDWWDFNMTVVKVKLNATHFL